MLWPGRPPNVVSVIVRLSDILLLLVPNLHPVVKHHDVDAPALTLIRRNSLLERLDRGDNHTLETLLVDGHLDSDVRERGGHSDRRLARVVRRILVTVRDGPEHLPQVAHDTDTEELG